MSNSRDGPTREVWEENKEAIRQLCLERNPADGKKLTHKEVLKRIEGLGIFATFATPNPSHSFVMLIGSAQPIPAPTSPQGVELPTQCSGKCLVIYRPPNHQEKTAGKRRQRAPSPRTPEGLPLSIETPKGLSPALSMVEPLPWRQFQVMLPKFSRFSIDRPSIAGTPRKAAVLSELAMRLAEIMPEFEQDDKIRRQTFFAQVSQSKGQFDYAVQVFFFLVSNNYYVPDVKKDWDMVKDMLRPVTTSGLAPSYLSLHKSTTMSAILEKLFQYAVLWTAKGDDDSLEFVKWLLDCGQDPNQNSDYHYPDAGICYPLLVAVSSQKVHLVRVLLDYGADANGQPRRGELSPLAAACSLRRPAVAQELVEMLLSNGARPNEPDEADGTKRKPALHCAIGMGYVGIAVLLLRHGANMHCWYRIDDIDEDLQYGSTALSDAAGFKPIVESSAELDTQHALSLILFLLSWSNSFCHSSQGPSLDPSTVTADVLIAAASSGNSAVVKFFSENGVSMDQENHFGLSPLCAAAFHGHYSTCALLLQLGISVIPTCPGVPSALHLAAFHGWLEIVTLLTQHGASASTNLDPLSPHYDHSLSILSCLKIATVSRDHRTPLLSTLSGGYLDCTMHLIRTGVAMSSDEFFLIVKTESLPLINVVLEVGADPNERNSHGISTLQLAVMDGELPIIQSLLAYGAELRKGELAHAFKLGDYILIQTLLEAGAIAEPSTIGETFLESAIFCPKRDVVSLAMMIDPTFDGGALCSAAFKATRDGDYSIAEALLSRRPATKLCDSLEAAAISIAALYGSPDLLHILTAGLPAVTGQCKIPARRGRAFTQVHHFTKLKWIPASRPTPLDAEGVPFWRDSEFIMASPLLAAVHRGDEGIAKRLLELRYPLDDITVSYAICSESELFPELLRYYSTMNPFSDNSFAMDHAYWAVEAGSISSLRLLQSAGQDICMTRAQGPWFEKRTVFQLAVEKGQTEVFDILVEAGANVNEPAGDSNGATAFQLAAQKGYLGIAERLLALGADASAPGFGRSGLTALMQAAFHGRTDMLQLLLNHCDRTRDNWKTEMLLAGAEAAFRGHYAIIDTLRREEMWSMVEEKKLEMMVKNMTMKVDWDVQLD
ncbi:Ankyrin repeat-containing domain protein [Ilyonectria robusta]